MDKVDKSILVWPWSQNLTYHALLDTLVNHEVPDEPRCLFPDSCFPDLNNNDHNPDPSVNLPTTVSNLNVSLTVITSTGMEKQYDDHVKARVDRSRLGLNLSYATCDRIVVMVMPDEPEEISLVRALCCQLTISVFHNICYCQAITDSSYIFCLHWRWHLQNWQVSAKNGTLQKFVSLTQQCMAALANYGKDWQFKTISSKASPTEVSNLFAGMTFVTFKLILQIYSQIVLPSPLLQMLVDLRVQERKLEVEGEAEVALYYNWLVHYVRTRPWLEIKTNVALN